MKKAFLLLLVPLLMSTQCDDDFVDSGFETSYILQNDSSVDLFLLNSENRFVEIKSNATVAVGSTLNTETSPIAPSESLVFNTVKLYTVDNDNFILVYNQDPIDDGVWILSEPTVNRYEYTLLISDALID